MNVLVLNSGSSTLKFQVIATDLERIAQDKDDRICRGDVEGIGGEAIIRIRYHNQPRQTVTEPLRDVAAALEYLIRYIASNPGVSEIKSAADVNAVGHRVVHGGEMFKDSALIDDSVLKGLEDCIDWPHFTIQTTSKVSRQPANYSAKTFPKWRCSTLPFIIRFPSRPTCMPFRIIFTGGTASGGTDFMVPLIATSPTAIVQCED